MEKILKQTQLPDCKIIRRLVQKMGDRKDFEFNYILYLEEIRKRISAEVTRINLLFPEYTPHDDKYHLSKLFFIADELLGEDIIENMNIVELFTFAISLYAHDWGMAISEDEKELILTGQKSSNEIFLLEDEDYEFSEFCKSRNIVKSEIEQTDWQDYIRETHAYRSGSRIKNYFSSINSGIAEVTSRLCEGHYVDFDIIDDPNSYPMDYAVLRETVNIKALAIYLRLVDLLDLGEDRTPYVLWKFVAPRNKFSKMEWSKHRALQPVSFANYQTGRYIQVDGNSDNQNVYMSIMDLKRYVNDQFKQSNDILNRMNHAYHKLNLSHIDWRIAARGFKPIPIQFEFDRMRMFEILGDEIYQNDGYVFIRELIQNAVDAIKVRMEVLDSKGLIFNGGKIIINVNDISNTYYCVTIIDNGVGMDEYIIRNYLSVAGRSYYNSKDFEKEGFKMEPISRFGIGVLSCFMLSDYVEIITNRDPYISSNSEKLKISIPSKENYFRIETTQASVEIGTTYHVYVLKDKLKEHKIEKFNVIEYVKEIAGFVEFPIEVNESGKKTIINTPLRPQNSKETSENISISYDFPYESAIKPQNINITKEYFTEKKFLLNEDLKLERFEGCITFLIPKNEDIDIVNIGRSWPISDVKLINISNPLDEECRIRWNDDWVHYNRGYFRRKDKGLSVNKCEAYSVFLNGILLPNASPPEISPRNKLKNYEDYSFSSIDECFLLPKLVVNVPRTNEIKIDLARSTMKENENWDSQIWEAFFKYFKENELNYINEQENRNKYFQIGKLSTFYRMTSKIILEKILPEKSEIPLPILTSNNKLEFINITSDNEKNELRLPCPHIKSGIKNLLDSEYIKYNERYIGFLKYRVGDNIVALSEDYGNSSFSSLGNANTIIESFIKKYYIIKQVEFIISPLGMDYPWIQEVYRVKGNVNHFDVLEIDLTQKEINDFSCEEIQLLVKQLKVLFPKLPKLLNFSSPYNNNLFFSWNYLNIEHPFTNLFIKLLVSIYKIKNTESISAEISGEIIDRINKLPFMDYLYDNKGSSLSDINEELKGINEFCLLHLISNYGIQKIMIEDIVPNSFVINNDILSEKEFEGFETIKEKWGNLIS